MAKYLEIENFVENLFRKLHIEQINPWLVFVGSRRLNVKDFYGKTINLQGICFSGTPVEIYRYGYIEPFIKDIIEQSSVKTVEFSAQYNQNINLVADYCLKILKRATGRTLRTMAKINNGQSIERDGFEGTKQELFDFAENVLQLNKQIEDKSVSLHGVLKEMAEHIREGLTAKEIANKRSVSIETITTQIKSLADKYGVVGIKDLRKIFK